MKSVSALLLFFLLSFSCAYAQKPVVSGYYVGEARGVSHDGNTYLLLKEFIPLDKEGEKKLDEQGMASYLNLPLEVEQVEVVGNSFRNILLCLDPKGGVRWRKDLGRSNTSTPWGIAVDPFGMIYVGERADSLRLLIRKLDPKGKDVWKTSVDSLQTFHAAFADTGAFVSVLASATIMTQVVEKDVMQYRSVNLYRTLRLNRETGEVESDDYNGQLTNACAGGFGEPQMNEHWINSIWKKDSLLLYVNFRDELLMIAAQELEGLRVMELTGQAGETFVLAHGTRPKEYRLLLDRFRPEDKFQKNLDVIVRDDYYNTFLCRNELGGVTLFFSGADRMEALKYDAKLETLWRQEYDLTKIGSDKVLAVVPDAEGNDALLYLTLEGKKRHVKFARLSPSGEWKK